MDSSHSHSSKTNYKHAHHTRPSNSLLSQKHEKHRPDLSHEPPREKVSLACSEEYTKRKDYEFKDPSYPRELLDLISTKECKLCNVQLTAPIMSNMHYTGKRHLKNVRQFMERWSFKHGQPIRSFKELNTTTQTETSKPEYCDCCNVEMYTLNEKILHLSGKKHIKNYNDPTKLNRSSRKRKIYEEDRMQSDSRARLRCKPCKMDFEDERRINEHQQSLKHKLCLLNQEDADSIIHGLELYYCMICKAQYKNNTEYTAHFFEEKHMTLDMNCGSLQNDLFYCTICSVHIARGNNDDHVNSLEHRKKVLLDETMKIITEMASKADNTLFYRCQDCPDTESMNFITFNNHLLSDSHVDRILRK